MSALTSGKQWAELPALYETDGEGELLDRTAYVKVFGPGRFTYYVTEWDGGDQVFGYCVSPLDSDCDEWGYASVSEWESAFYPFRPECDSAFAACPLREALQQLADSGLADCERYRGEVRA